MRSHGVKRPVEAVLLALNGGALLGIALLTSVDVIGRYLVRSPLPAAYELVQLLMGVMVFAGLPLATSRREHLTVGLLDGRLRPWLERARALLIDLISASFLAVLAVFLALHAARLSRAGESLMVTQIAIAPVVWGMALATLASALIVIVHVARNLARAEVPA